MEEPFVRHLDRRRAVLAVLVRARPASRTIPEITAALKRDGMPSPDNKKLADVLANLVRRGRAVRVARGCYRAGTLSRSTEWRVLNWKLLAERWRIERALLGVAGHQLGLQQAPQDFAGVGVREFLAHVDDGWRA